MQEPCNVASGQGRSLTGSGVRGIVLTDSVRIRRSERPRDGILAEDEHDQREHHARSLCGGSRISRRKSQRYCAQLTNTHAAATIASAKSSGRVGAATSVAPCTSASTVVAASAAVAYFPNRVGRTV